MSDPSYIQRYAELADSGTPFVSVTMVDAIGSTPQDAGSKMLVTTNGLFHGTVGGGRVEAKAIDHAQAMLNDKTDTPKHTDFVDWNLQKDVGMTCGGTVKLYFETVNHRVWRIVIFGAGHVTQSLTKLLTTLPCRVTCIDPCADWLAKLPTAPNIETITTDDPPAQVASLPDDAFVICMTRGHKSDVPVLIEIYKQKRVFPYLGVIGSKSKAAIMRRELTEAGIPMEQQIFHCPLGLPIGTNHPGEIAVSIAAQLLEVRDKLAAASIGG
ncbi:MAG: xanthine dehydrogenase accessory protein XdhC [Phycisphaerales bacterium]